MKCIVCNGENVLEGSLTSSYGVVFCEKGTENKFRPNAYKVKCFACTDCGAIFDLRIDLDSKKKGKKKDET